MVKKLLTQSSLRFSLGTLIMVYETVFTTLDRPWLLVIAAGLMGYSLPKRLDKILNGGEDE